METWCSVAIALQLGYVGKALRAAVETSCSVAIALQLGYVGKAL